MENKKRIAFADMADQTTIPSLNCDLLEVTDDLNGLKSLVRMFYISYIQNDYCGPAKGSSEYYDMIDDIFAHIVSTLNTVVTNLDEISTNIDRADIKTA